MRLTLRTLLAYLDNTLDPSDAEILKAKLTESDFATQLVLRIRKQLTDESVSALPPESVGPVDDANVIGEYLDSTLPVEQVAEIERACLESDVRLAEAAACHQILTMALGKSASVSPELRQRIIELPEREIDKIAAASERFSSLTIDDPQTSQAGMAGSIPGGSADSLAADLPTIDSPLTQPSQPVEPVGPTDSGVSDAPTRLRESSVGAAAVAEAEPTAGKRRRLIDESRLYGGSIRPSRIAPWIVSLALAAVLLFALVQIFQPLLGPSAAMNDENPQAEVESQSEMAPVDSGSGDSGSGDSGSGDSGSGDSGSGDSFPGDLASGLDRDAESSPAAMELPARPGVPDVAESDVSSDSNDDFPATEFVTPEPSDPTSSEPATSGADSEIPTSETPTSEATDTVAAVEPSGGGTTVPDSGEAVPVPPPSEAIEKNAITTGAVVVTSDHTLLCALNTNDQWLRAKRGMTIPTGTKILCAPTFRGQMMLGDGVELTMVGPAQVQWVSDAEKGRALSLDFGRVLLASTEPGVALRLLLGGQPIDLTFADPGTAAAASIQQFRAPGFDPLAEDSRMGFAGILTVQGSLGLALGGSEDTLSTSEQWVKRGTQAARVSAVQSRPDWIDPPEPNESTLEASAREGLMELIDTDQPLEKALREATLFRRSEVAALAAQTLVYLGQGDVYFGGDGILSESKQKAYWPDHFLTLLSTVDGSAEAAERLQAAINKMDSANATSLFRLLIGFSQKQLVEGSDEALVAMLDSDSMAVRVLALENLHKITGTTLYFRAEQENAIRRAPGIKKWVARQRKGDIRWTE